MFQGLGEMFMILGILAAGFLGIIVGVILGMIVLAFVPFGFWFLWLVAGVSVACMCLTKIALGE